MPTFLSCLPLEHDLLYTSVALLLCAAGSILAMRLLARVRRHTGARQLHLLFLAGLVAGGVVWTTHFAAMLGYKVPVARAFEPGLTLLSLAVAIGLAVAGFYLCTRTKLGPMIEIGGAVFGLGIVAMHYCGMAAFKISGLIEWSAIGVGLSIVAGMTFGAVATNRIARPVTRFCKYGGSLSMALAIVTTHYTAMGAMTIVPLNDITVEPQAISDLTIITAITAVVALIMTMAASAYKIDLHAARETSDAYEHLALHDPLTGIANRHGLARHLAALIDNNPDDTARIVYLVIDLDRFKDVNDFHGHAAGDHVLRTLARRLSDSLEPREFLARIGGDEFVAIKSNAFARGEAVRFAERLLALIDAPVENGTEALSVGASVGIALYPEHGGTGDLLASRADLAMFRAKSRGQNKICIYDSAMDEASRSRAALAIELKLAIATGQLEVHYQPQNDSRTREIIGFEALLRWNHPSRGRVPPDEFIPIAEQSGLIIEIGDWVLRTACATAASWTTPHRVAVNVAPLQLARADLQSRIAEILRETGLPASRLELEITESGIIADQQHALQIVLGLKALGVTVAMDDFGTGYSSLATLRNIPFDKIKVDRSFVRDIDSNAHSAAIIRATLVLAKSLRIPVLAEGVETEEQFVFLRDADCDSVQGYLFGKPMSAADVDRLIASPAPAAMAA